MIDSQEFFSDLVNVIPINTVCILQSSFTELLEAMKGIPYVNEGAVLKINFQDTFRNQLLGFSKNNFYECINYFEILQNGKRIIEAFDGFIIVTISKDFKIKNTALSKYLDQDLLYISDKW